MEGACNNTQKNGTIIIKIPTEGLTDEYGLLELQGDFASQTDTGFEGKFIGDMHYTKTGQPLLIIGHHLLYGKEIKMEKPFALLDKVKNAEGQTEFLIKCVIKKKVVFKTRPKPIVGLCEKK